MQCEQLPVPPHGTLLTFRSAQLQGLWEHSTKVPSLFNPATHTFKMAQEADAATSGEGNLGTNVVWMFPKVESLSPRATLPAGRLSSRVPQRRLALTRVGPGGSCGNRLRTARPRRRTTDDFRTKPLASANSAKPWCRQHRSNVTTQRPNALAPSTEKNRIIRHSRGCTSI